MKSPAFDYIRASSPQHALQLLAQHGDDACLLAGGQTLMATLNMRLSQPTLVVDIGGLTQLAGITLHGRPGEETLRIGALTRHVEIEESPLVALHAPLMTQAAPHIAHRAIRNLGTLGGTLAYADPAAEWPACVVALGGTLVLLGEQGERRVPAASFFQGLFATARRDDELLIACELPVIAPGQRHHFSELARRHGDYAIAGLAACATVQAQPSSARVNAQVSGQASGQASGQVSGQVTAPLGAQLSDVRLAFLSLGDRPVRATAAEAVLAAGPLNPARIDEADAALRAELQPFADLTHSAAAKTQMAATLMRRAVKALLAQ